MSGIKVDVTRKSPDVNKEIRSIIMIMEVICYRLS